MKLSFDISTTKEIWSFLMKANSRLNDDWNKRHELRSPPISEFPPPRTIPKTENKPKTSSGQNYKGDEKREKGLKVNSRLFYYLIKLFVCMRLFQCLFILKSLLISFSFSFFLSFECNKNPPLWSFSTSFFLLALLLRVYLMCALPRENDDIIKFLMIFTSMVCNFSL